MRFAIFFIALCTSSFAASAESMRCMSSLDRMISNMEEAAEADSDCLRADLIEYALNAGGDAQDNCKAEGKSLARRYMLPLAGQLQKAVLSCGK